jgi:predicted HTH transcriptional regulator
VNIELHGYDPTIARQIRNELAVNILAILPDNAEGTVISIVHSEVQDCRGSTAPFIRVCSDSEEDFTRAISILRSVPLISLRTYVEFAPLAKGGILGLV